MSVWGGLGGNRRSTGKLLRGKVLSALLVPTLSLVRGTSEGGEGGRFRSSRLPLCAWDSLHCWCWGAKCGTDS